MDNRKRQSKINLPGEVVQTRRRQITQASLYTGGYSGFPCAFFENPEHFLLNIDTYDFTARPDHPCQRNTEKPHCASVIQHGHPFPDIRV